MINHLLPILLAPLIDRCLGEPARFHPLVGFGHVVQRVEAGINTGRFLFLRGAFSWILLTLPICLVIYFIDQKIGGWWLAALCGWLSLGWQSLRQHGLAVFKALRAQNLTAARQKTAYLVSRDTVALDQTGLSRATIESLLENGSDAIFAPLFWLLIAGAPGVVFYRLCNTLDAMWGYRSERFEQFGKMAARVDDILNYIPARLTALLYVLNGHRQPAIQAWKTQGKLWYSPNAGVVMAAGAGALQLQLGGDAVYHGKIKQRPALGCGPAPDLHSIQRAIALIDRSVYSLLALTIILSGGLWLVIPYVTP